MENRLKKETKPVLKELNEARIRTVMITGTWFGGPHKLNVSQAYEEDHVICHQAENKKCFAV